MLKFGFMYLLQSSSNQIAIYASFGNCLAKRESVHVFPMQEDYDLIENLKFSALRQRIIERIVGNMDL